MKQLLRIAGALLAALLIGVSAGYAFVSLAPCSWFSPTLDGTCVYQSTQYGILFGHLIIPIAFALIMCLINVGESGPTAAPARLTNSWLALFAFQCFDLAAYTLPLGLPSAPLLLSRLLLGGLVVASMLLAPYRARHPAIVLLALFPVSGPVLLGPALYLGKRQASIESGVGGIDA